MLSAMALMPCLLLLKCLFSGNEKSLINVSGDVQAVRPNLLYTAQAVLPAIFINIPWTRGLT